MMQGDCSVVPEEHRATTCERKWLTLAANVVVEPSLLLAAVDKALLQLYSKAGLPLPEGFVPFDSLAEDLAALESSLSIV